MSFRAGQFSSTGFSLKESGIAPQPDSKLSVSDFAIDIDTNLISRCPGGHYPRYTGVSKGQSIARFAFEACDSCSLCGESRCPGKRQAKDYIVRFSLKAIEACRFNEEKNAGKVAAAQSTQPECGGGLLKNELLRLRNALQSGFSRLAGLLKSIPASTLQKSGLIAAVVCLLIVVTAFFGGMLWFPNDTNDLPADESAEEQVLPLTIPYEDTASIGDSFPNLTPLTSSFDITDDDDAEEEENAAEDFADDDDILEDDSPDSDDTTQTSEADGGTQSSNDTDADSTADQFAAVYSPEGTVFPYLLYVSKHSYTIAVLTLDENNEYTRLLRTYSTAIGRTSAQTRAGRFTITGKTRWIDWGNSYSPFGSKHSGGLWFHGPLYRARSSGTLITRSYNQIGSSATAGCMRTTTEAAVWIYYNCAEGTPVIIANDSRFTSVVPAQVDDSQTFDPTDPDIHAVVYDIPPMLNHEDFETVAQDESMFIE